MIWGTYQFSKSKYTPKWTQQYYSLTSTQLSLPGVIITMLINVREVQTLTKTPYSLVTHLGCILPSPLLQPTTHCRSLDRNKPGGGGGGGGGGG